ncbi:MAG: twitching motility protein PilT [Geobacteraceae bacterium GWC2_58_44]|nr:MAG: twitching motility protein PilT [Geobacteraceae bacterium GWC2_58_44]
MRRILLDTHVYLWWLDDSPKLSHKARKMIENAEIVYVSSASIWEAVIKIRTGKLELEVTPDELIEGIERSGFVELPILAEHALAVYGLANHHKDPFDRMLVAQAISEPLLLLTVDPEVQKYSPDLVFMI